MAFIDIYNASVDATFQGRCLAAAWKSAQQVVAETNGYDVTQPSKDFAYSLLRDQTRITPKQVAMQVLRNATIAGNIAGSTDNDIEYQINQVWSDLVSIG